MRNARDVVEWLLIIAGAVLIAVFVIALILAFFDDSEPVAEVPEELDVLILGMTSQEACSSYKYLGNGEVQYYYNYLGVDQNLFWQAWGLNRFGHTKIVGERTSFEVTPNGESEKVFECYYEMLRVCDSDFVCQDYSKRFLVKESELGDWCQGQCYS